MRRGTVLISVVAHGGVLALIARCRPTEEVHHDEVAASNDTIALEFVALDPATPVAPSMAVSLAGSSSQHRGGGRGPAAVHGSERAAGAAGSDVVGPEPEDTSKEPAFSLRMRGQHTDLTLGHDVAGPASGGKEEPSESRWSYDPKIKMRPNGGGSQQIRDPVANIDIAPDGTVDIKDKPLITFHVELPTPSDLRNELKRAKRELAAWVADPYRKTRVGSTSDLPRHLQAVSGACDQWGAAMCFTAADQAEQWALEDEDLESTGGKLAGGKADLTGYLMKKLVGDPYASRKLKMLDQTRADRVRAGESFRREQLDRSAVMVQNNLVALWRSTPDPAERRAALFALWDECTEGEGEAGAAGERARVMVLGWIRSHLPEGNPDAFTAEEIQAFDARRTSRQHFIPYAK